MKKVRFIKPKPIEIELFDTVCKKLSFLDDINSALSFPETFLHKHHDNMMIMSENYRMSNTIDKRTNNPLDIIELAKVMLRLNDPAGKYYEQLESQVITKNDNGEYIHVKTMNLAAIEKSVFYDLVSILNFGRGIYDIYANAKNGNVNDFMKLLVIDKSCIYEDWAKRLLLRNQYIANWQFFDRIAISMSKRPFNEKKTIPKAIVLVALFWNSYFKRLSYKRITQFLVDKEVLPKSIDPDTFRRSLNRVNLKKERYNRKVGH